MDYLSRAAAKPGPQSPAEYDRLASPWTGRWTAPPTWALRLADHFRAPHILYGGSGLSTREKRGHHHGSGSTGAAMQWERVALDRCVGRREFLDSRRRNQ